MSGIDRMIAEIEQEVQFTKHMIGRDALDDRVMDAMRKVPREHFVPASLQAFAFENGPLSIGYDQTMPIRNEAKQTVSETAHT